jgi:hypothetical protein
LMFYNILPGGDTLMHKLHTKGDLMEQLWKLLIHTLMIDQSLSFISLFFLNF